MRRCAGCFNEFNEELEVCPYCGYAEGSYAGNNMYLAHGTVLSGRYTIGNILSSDGISVTYAAWDNNSDIRVNVREFFPEGYVTRSSSAVIPLNEECKAHFEAGFSNFVEEAKQLFSGNGDVRLYDCIAENNTAYMILESMETISSPAAYVQTAPVSKAPAVRSKGLPKWAKILISSVAGVVVAGAGLTVLFTSGILNRKEIEEPEETEETVETTKGITVDVEVMDYKEHSYACYGEADSWESAKDYCEQLGGHLVVINSAKENEAVWNYVNSKGYESVYLGLSDTEEEGNWKWVNGDPVEYTNWKEGEPNAYTDAENYAEYAFDVEGGYWNDFRYDTHAGVDEIHYVCEWDFEVTGSSNISYEELIATLPTATPMASPTPTPVIIDEEVLYSAYREVLTDYESEMRIVEDVKWDPTDSCALTDLTGDGYPELLILYCTDDENGVDYFDTANDYMSADVLIYTVIPGETTATEMLRITRATGFAAYGRKYSDIILLSNGNLLVETADGDDFWYTTYTEYAVDGYSYQKICSIECNEENVYSDNYEVEYLLNEITISEDEYNTYVDNYMNMFTKVLAMHPYTNTTSNWGLTVLDTPNCSLSFDEVWSILNHSQVDEDYEEDDEYIEEPTPTDNSYYVNKLDGWWMCIGGLPDSAIYSYRFTETSKETYINNDDGSRTFDSSEPVEYEMTSDGEIIVHLTDKDGYYYQLREFENDCVLDFRWGETGYSGTSSLYRAEE